MCAQVVGVRLARRPVGRQGDQDNHRGQLETVLMRLRANGRAASTRNQYVKLLKKALSSGRRKRVSREKPDLRGFGAEARESAQRNRRLVPDVFRQGWEVKEPSERSGGYWPRPARGCRISSSRHSRRVAGGGSLSLQWRDVNLDAAS